MPSLIPEGKQQYFNNAGVPLVGGKLYTYLAGTAVPKVTYQDADGTVPNTNPIILDARGECQVFWSGSYKVILKDALDNTIWTVDKVTETNLGYRTSSSGSAIIPSGTTAQRDAVPSPGYFRYNVDLNCFEGRYAASWRSIAQSVNGTVIPDGGDILLKTVGGVSIVGAGDIAVQAPLVSGTNIKTINSQSLLGAGNLTITAPGGGGSVITGSVTLTSASGGSISVTPTAPGLYATLPDATTMALADNLFAIYNAGDHDYGVKNSAGTQLGWVKPRTGVVIGLAENALAAGTWITYGLSKVGLTANYVSVSIANMADFLKRVTIDANRTLFLFGGTDCYGMIYDASSQSWGAPTLIRASIGSGKFVGVLSAAAQALVVTCDATTGMEAVTLTLAGTGITVNSGVKATAVLSGNIAGQAMGPMIAVGTSWVVSYGTNVPDSQVRALTVAVNTPTIGAAQVLNATAGAQSDQAQLWASGAVVRTLVGQSTNLLACKPFTVAAAVLTPGTEATAAKTGLSFHRAFLNGNGNIFAHYINTSHFAAIFKLTGTVEAVSTITIGTVPTNTQTLGDCLPITASKTAVIAADGSNWYCNIVTDTAGVVSAGTQVTNAHVSPSAVQALVVSGNNFRAGVAGTSKGSQLLFDCSGASPSLTSAIDIGIAGATTSAAVFAASLSDNTRKPQVLNNGTSVRVLGTTSSMNVFDLQTNPAYLRYEPSSGAFRSGGIAGAAANESWLGSNTISTGLTIQRWELAA